MSLKRIFTKKKEFRCDYQDPLLMSKAYETISSWIPDDREIVVLCIGTDRSTGDALGPIIGSFLTEKPLNRLQVYGTLESPVHAVNLVERLQMITEKHPNAYIIAIDACLGRTTSIGSIIASPTPLRPGAALKKNLPAVGDAQITGIVNASGEMEYFVLQNTRLHLVMQLAYKISALLLAIDRKQVPLLSPDTTAAEN
ncbi:putative sporulation protein YyaC [Terribacillus halophilus]|uniref:Putative sporulation protein YyaC n=1 Tax=Terribacillus halophilus TaxID=361279 RepID=A0A1G6LZ19_9BACI|nr:spore protease YyaC [Terribacillus halophilus]SDC47975.1 putative sporulation protein YyaC [Terribacillus halophilus]